MGEDRANIIQHLNMIQGIITRMSTNSFLLKGWTVTLVAGLFALSDRSKNQGFFLIAYMPTILFWLLDSYYLLLGRRYRVLYDKVREKRETDFSLKWDKSWSTTKTQWPNCFFSISEMLFYLPIICVIALVMIAG